MAFIRGAREGITGSGRGRSGSHITAALLLVTASLMASYLARAGDLDKVFTFNIKAQMLDKALLEFGTQAHVQMLLAWDTSTARLRTHELKGSYTAKAALAELLRGTRLKYVAQGNTLEILPRALVDSNPPGRTSKSSGAEHTNGSSHANTITATAPDPPLTNEHSRSRRSTQALGEVIVTAQKYRQAAFDVPISLEVISAQKLEEHGVTDLSNLQYEVPGMYVNSTGISNAVYLRGVGNFYGTGALVGEYIDDADITAEGFLGATGYATGDNGLYDLDRVEVLRGPQGTLYGDGSIGGVIRYITNRPALDRFQMSSDVAALFTEYGAPSQRIETMVNTPLVLGTLGLRLAGEFEHDGGWVDEPAASLKNINGGNLADVRIEALWQPSARLKVKATQIVHRHAYGIGMGEDASGNFMPLFNTTFVPNGVDNSDISNLTVTYEFAGARLLSSSTHSTEEQNIYNIFSSQTLGPTTYWSLVPLNQNNDKGSSEELRLVHAERGPWQWTVGGLYKSFTDFSAGDAYSGLAGSPLSSAYYIPVAADTERSSSRSWAGFADTSYTIGRLTFGAGVRYFTDRETFGNTFGVPFEATTFKSTDPRFYLQYRMTRHIHTYASASKGFRSGGFNYSLALPPYKPESLWNYELGTKITFPRKRVRANVALFYSDYSNFVTESYIPPFPFEANVGKARIKGVDADLTWRPLDRWSLELNTEILDTTLLTATAISGYAAGERLPFAPKYSFTSSVARDFLWNDKPGEIELYYYEMSRVQYRTATIPLAQSDVMRFLNCRVDLHWTSSLRLGLFAQNLLNDRGYESPFYSLGESVRPRPRTVGVEFGVSFE